MHELVNQKLPQNINPNNLKKNCQLQISVMPFVYAIKELEIGFEVFTRQG